MREDSSRTTVPPGKQGRVRYIDAGVQIALQKISSVSGHRRCQSRFRLLFRLMKLYAPLQSRREAATCLNSRGAGPCILVDKP